jgi:hypothetical protein
MSFLMFFWRKNNTRNRVVVFVVLAFLVMCLVVGVLLRSNEMGVCVREGRSLSALELRQRVIKNYIRIISQDSKALDAGIFSGVVVSISTLDLGPDELLAIADQARHTNKAIPENFAFRPKYIDLNGIDQAISQSTYSIVEYFPSLHVLYITRPESIQAIQRPSSIAPPSLLDRFVGYGNYFYRYERKYTPLACCDSPNFTLGLSKAAHYQSLQMVLKIASPQTVMQVSNCGDIRLSPRP